MNIILIISNYYTYITLESNETDEGNCGRSETSYVYQYTDSRPIFNSFSIINICNL